MKARDILTTGNSAETALPSYKVGADVAVVDLIPRLLESPGHRLEVMEGEKHLGVIDESSLLEGLNRMIASRDDSSMIVVETTPAAYSASRIAQAVEDADTHLVDLWSVPSENGMIKVTLRVRSTDPSAAVHNLERYDYDVVEAVGQSYGDATTAIERLLELKALLNV